ncbi:MAG TPA: hypothetical protein VJZ76_07765 [Thermoanaerobaculia bacterium]|nr:hypothetical protein [Thermoanaerobaculia bacterium]
MKRTARASRAEELVETSLAAISNLGPGATPLRELAVLVRDRVR